MRFEKLRYVVPIVLFMACSNMNSTSMMEQLQNGHYNIKYDNKLKMEMAPGGGYTAYIVKK